MNAPRGGLLSALAAAVICITPVHGTADDTLPGREYATVGRIVVRRVEGRTMVVVPVAGRVQPTLSEPFRVGDHWRIYLTIHDARLSVGGRPRTPAGLLALNAEEIDGDVRISIDVAVLGDYGARPSEEGMILWINPERRPVRPVTTPLVVNEAASTPEQPQAAPSADEGTGWTGLVVLAVLAAAAGAAVRYVRRNGIPVRLRYGIEFALTGFRDQLSRQLARVVPSRSAAPEPAEPHVPFDTDPADPRGSSADIGDAFRLEPDRPASGIAALAATNVDNDA